MPPLLPAAAGQRDDDADDRDRDASDDGYLRGREAGLVLFRRRGRIA